MLLPSALGYGAQGIVTGHCTMSEKGLAWKIRKEVLSDMLRVEHSVSLKITPRSRIASKNSLQVMHKK